MPIPFNHIVARLLSTVWYLAFKEPPPEGLLRHLDRMLFFGAGMIAARILSAVTQILLGRTLGQTRYGELTIIVLLASYFSLPISSGWGAAFARIVAVQSDPRKNFQALRSLLLIALGCGLAVSLGLYAFRGPMGAWLHIDRRLMDLTLLMSLFYAWWSLAKQIAQALQAWRTYVAVDLGWAVIALGLVILLVVVGRTELAAICAVFWIGYFCSGMAAAKFVVKSFGTGSALTFAGPILQHGGLMLLNGLTGVAAYSIDRILLQYFLGAREVGLYQAHFLATYGLVGSLMTLMLTYAFPLFCRDDRNLLRQTLRRITRLQYAFTLAASAVVGIVALWLYGYPVSLPLFACLCLFGSIQFHGQVKAWYIASKGAAATRQVLGSQVIFLLVNIALLSGLARRLGITAGGISLLVAALAALFYLIRTERRLTGPTHRSDRIGEKATAVQKDAEPS
jgi:O-antigen/teichoic acid export membrane protein